MFRIKRPQLLAQIWELSKNGSVVLTGSPGVGKSWMIAQLIRECRAENRPYLPIAAEDFDIRSIDELGLALQFKTDILSFLKTLGAGPVLLIDGLDALRGELSQRAFRELIRRVSREVSNCSVIASIRTFDLQQSEQLQQLFFSSWPGRSVARTFAEVAVPPFSEEDLEAVIQQVPGLRPLVESSGPDMGELLRIPFNLHIAASLIQNGVTAEVLAGFQSQVQLLNKYWRLRIEETNDSSNRKQLLRKIVTEMVNNKSLSVSEAEVDSAPSEVIAGLQSDEILRKGVTGRVSFSHNILFDYGSARLLLDEESVFSFVREDPSRTIFYRPTLSYFFRNLWVKDRNLFWRTAFSFIAAKDLPERATIVPSIVIQETAGSLDDLTPLIESSSPAKNKAIAGVLRAIQTLGGLTGERRRLWIDALRTISDGLDLEFINEYISLLSIASESSDASQERAYIGKIACRFLRWIWSVAPELERHQAVTVSDIGAARVFPIAMKFAAGNVNEVREIVRELLKRFGSPTAGSHEAFWLAHEINRIVEIDAELAADVYERAFAHKETSEETTSIGGSVVLTLTSTRRQDFTSALYGLQTGFNRFLDVAAVAASSAATRSVEAEMEREKPIDPDEQQTFRFPYGDAEATYLSDHSEIWDSGFREYNSLNLLDSALKRLSEMLKEDARHEVGLAMLRCVLKYAQHAVVWKHLLETSALNIREMYRAVVPLLTISSFIAAPEVTVAVGNVLTAAYQADLVGDADAAAIEAAIADVPKAQLILRYEKPESIRNRLLRCIPAEQLRSTELKALSAALEGESVRKNEPFFRSSFSSGTFSPEDWLREQGVDTDAPENSNILEALRPLREFEHKYLNEVPSVEESGHAEWLLRHLQQLLQQGPKLPDALDEQVIGTMCAVAESILKDEKLAIGSSILQLCKEIVLAGTKHPSPKFIADSGDKFDMPAWGSPSPRIDAAQGLGHFIWNWGVDEPVTVAFEELSRDKVPAVRYQVASFAAGLYKHGAFERFWSLITEMMTAERTTGVMLAIVSTLGRVAGQEPKRVVELLSSAIERGLPRTERHDLTHSLLGILAGLFIARGDSGANEILLRFESDPVTFHREMIEEILVASIYLAPPSGNEPDTRMRARQVLERVLFSAYSALQNTIKRDVSDERTKEFRDLLGLQDEVATRVRFALEESRGSDEAQTSTTENDRRVRYFELKPILELLTTRRNVPGPHYLAPHSAHYLMETMNFILPFDPESVVEYAAAICTAASAMSYQFDSMAISEAVKLVERVLADHKDVLRDNGAANALGTILDIFVRAGWPQALQLTFTLDQAIR